MFFYPYFFNSTGGGLGFVPVGVVEASGTSRPPPPRTVDMSARTFQAPTPGAFEFTDEFTGTEPLNGHAVSTWTPAQFHDATTPYTWTDSEGNTVGGGAANINGTSPTVNADSNDEFDMPNGVFLETEYSGVDQMDQVLIAWNLGGSNGSLVISGYDGGHSSHIRVDCGGFNGALTSGGALLPADPADTVSTYSASFTANRVYTAQSEDWRNRLIRLEIRKNRFTLLVGGVVYMDQPMRFDLPLYASRDDTLMGNYTNLSLWGLPYSGDPADNVQVKYVRVGSL